MLKSYISTYPIFYFLLFLRFGRAFNSFDLLNTSFITAEEAPEFLNRVAFEFECLQETLHLFVIRHRSLDRRRFGSVFVVLTNGADNIVPIAVNGMEEIFFFLNM